MFTLQILDRGQSFLHPLDASAVVIGSDPTADIRLAEAGVLPRHARLEPRADGVRLQALGEVLVNGKPVERVALALGDRIEIGKAVVVVGRSVTRRTRPDEVLADGPSPSRLARSRPPKQKRGWLPFAIAGVVLAGVVGFIAQGDDTVLIRNELAAVARLRDAGQLEPAAAAIERLRQQWASAADDRLHQLDGEQAKLDAIHATIERLTAQVLDPSIDRSYAQWMIELRRLEGGDQPVERVAARQVRGVLRETIEQRPRLAVAPSPDEEPPATETPAPAPVPVTPPRPVTPPPTASTSPPPSVPESLPPATVGASAAEVTVQGRGTGEAVDVIRAEADRLVAKGLFVQAIAVVQSAMAAAPDEQRAHVLGQHLTELRADALRHAHVLVAQARQSVRTGHAPEAVAMLREAQPRFPSTNEFGVLNQALDEALDEVDEVVPPSMAATSAPTPTRSSDQGTSGSTLLELRSQLDAVRRAEEDGAFATAVELLHEAATMVRERDAAFADRLLRRAEAAEFEAAWHTHVAAAIAAGRPMKVTTREGRAVTVRSAVDERLVVAAGNGDERLPWTQVSPLGLSLLVEQTQPTAEAAIGAAVLFYGAGDASRAEALLAKVLPAAPALKQAIDGVVSRGRDEPVDERGYTLGREGFVSARAVELQKAAQKLLARLDGVLRDRDPSARLALLAEMMRGDADQLSVLRSAMDQEVERQLAKIAASPVRKQLERLNEPRAVLEAARDHARSLIYDEDKYFYPYKPPAVSSDRFAEYNRVQAEVNDRVDALRAAWKDDRVRVRVPATLRVDLERLDWVANALGQLAPFDESRLAVVEWARAVPALDTVGLRDHCRNAAERADREQWRLVEAYNLIAGKSMPSSVREQLRITNDYRAMFGHRPLAIVRVVCEAAQGHAEEMSRLGYFAHMSPTPGRRTPYDRMQLAGYADGVSENIALCDSALTAHNSWCGSSGHHRNLLDPTHVELGVGADGRNWVQNFGSGSVHQQEPAWQTALEQQGR